MKPAKTIPLIVAAIITLALVNFASAGYDTYTGRFQQQDPLGRGPRVVFTGNGPQFVGTNGPQIRDPRPVGPNPLDHATPSMNSVSVANINPRVATQQRYARLKNPGQAAVITIHNAQSHSQTGRWTSQEQVNIPEDQYLDGMNLYQYCKSNPINYVDPYGLKVFITVEGAQKGVGILYGKKGMSGTKYVVPLYLAVVWSDKVFGCALPSYPVTRDTADDLAPSGDRTPEERRGRYTTNHEAPPGIYHGRFHTSPALKEEVVFISDEPGGISMGRRHRVRRTYIYIHRGPGMSQGCLLGQSGKAGQEEFIKGVKWMICLDKRFGGSGEIQVVLWPRI